MYTLYLLRQQFLSLAYKSLDAAGLTMAKEFSVESL